MISNLDVESKDRGVVRNAFTSQFDTYRVDAVDINAGGAGCQAGDALFLSGAGLFIPATIVVEAVDTDGAVAAAAIGGHGSFVDDPSGAELTPPGGRGSGASFDVSAASGPSSTLADVVLPLLNDTVTVLQDETHNGETWQWNYADYNGDGVANWVPNHKIDSELRDFTADPIAADEIAGDAVTDAKIGARTLADQPADGGLVSTAAKTLTAWLQGVRNNLKHVFDKGLFKTDAAGFFKNDGSLGCPTAAQVGLGNVDNTSGINKPVSTAQAAAVAEVQSAVDAHEADEANPHGVTADLLQTVRNNLKYVLNNLLTKTAANTWAAVPYTAGANFTKSGFSVKYNAALNVMRIHFNADLVATFTIGMTLLTLTLPKSISSTQRGLVGADMFTGTTQVGRMSISINVVSGGALTLFPRITTQTSGAVPSLDNCKLYGDVWVYLD